MRRVVLAVGQTAAFLAIVAGSVLADVEYEADEQRPASALPVVRFVEVPSAAPFTTTATSTSAITTTTTTALPRHLLVLHERVLAAIARGPDLPPGWRYVAWPQRYETSRDGHVALDGDTNVYIHPDRSDSDADIDETVAHEVDHAWCLSRGGVGADAPSGEPLCDGRRWAGRAESRGAATGKTSS